MASYFLVLAVMAAAAGAAPPAPQRLYTQAPAQLQNINPYDYYLDNPEVVPYYNQAQQKQGNPGSAPNGAPSRLETLDPDSEVELIPGAQQPQQPPQQTPVSPNLPGLVPGQRVFIVHMPVPGYRPGSIGGYQPVYIVAAGAQGNPGFPGNGFQNAVLLDPTGQTVISPLVGYPRVPQQGINPGVQYLLTPQLQGLRGPYEGYQEPTGAYPAQPAQQIGAPSRPVQLSQLIALQTHAANAANSPRASNEQTQNAEPKRLAQSRESNETKEAEDTRHGANARPLPAHAQTKP